ncbi:acyltransferase domain-containing protein [Streptomyces sp. NPDC055078]
MTHTIVQFPGLGGYVPGFLESLQATESRVAEVLRDVDRAAREYGLPPVSVPLTDPDGPPIEELAGTPARLHLASLATGLSLHGELAAHGQPGDVLLGHSTGELTALAAAGCLSAYDAARVLCEREVALAEGDVGGGLTALRVGARRAEHLCGAVGGWTLRPSLFNAPRQTVVSGNTEELARLEGAARALGIQATRLLVVYPHHNPELAGAARRVAATTVDYRIEEPRRRVYSPLLGRLVRGVEDVRRIIDRHLTDPVHYLAALRELYTDYGAGVFLEAGPRPLLTECAAECLPPDAELVGPPPGVTDGRKTLHALLERSVPGAPRHPDGRQGAAGRSVPSRPASRGSDPDGDTSARPHLSSPPDPVEAPPASVSASASRPVAEADAPGPAPESPLPDRAQLVAELRQTFSDALGYPEDVFTEDAHLEADLGIASVKRTELLVSLLDRYDLPTPPAELRIRDYNTLPKLADLMLLLAAGKTGADDSTDDKTDGDTDDDADDVVT